MKFSLQPEKEKPLPPAKHSVLAEKIARGIVLVSLIAAAACTIVVMVL